MFLLKLNSVFGFKVQEFFSDSGLTVDHGVVRCKKHVKPAGETIPKIDTTRQ